MKKIILISIGILTYCFAHTQILYVAGTTLTVFNQDSIHPTLFVPDSLIIAPTGRVANSYGCIQLNGSISNYGTYTSNGTETFSGLADQVIAGTYSGSSYLGSITKQNRGNLVLATNTDCNSLTFASNGTIDCSLGQTLYVQNAASNSISGQTSLRYVDVGTTGFLRRNVDDTAAGHWYDFPMGNASGYRNFSINLSTLGSTGPSTITGSLISVSGMLNYDAYYPTGFSRSGTGTCFAGPDPQWLRLTGLANDGWNISGPLDYGYRVTGYHPGYRHDLRRIITCPAGTSTWQEHITQVTCDSATAMCEYSDWTGASTTIPGGPYRGFGDFACAGSDGTVLPVALLDFTAEPVENQFIRLSWTTTIEINNDHFVIERSMDGVSFTEIGEQSGHGTTTETRSYDFNDYNVTPSISYYYRLRQIDYDGHSELSPVVSAMLKKNLTTVVVINDPYENYFTIIVQGYSEKSVVVSIVDMLGKGTSETIGSHSPVTIIRREFTGSVGIYLVRVDIENKTYNFKLLKTAP